MNKFGRSYRLTIDPGDGGPAIIVVPPLTLRFTVQKSIQSSLNTCVLDIFNLSNLNRNRIFQDRNIPRFKTLQFDAGYDVLTTVFKGDIFEANSYREGPNIITMMECRSGEYDVANTNSYVTLDKGQTIGDILKYLIGEFEGLTLGAVGDYSDKVLRPVALKGNTYDLLQTYSNNQVFINDGKVYVLKNNEALRAELPIIGPETGLLQSPRRDDGFLTVTTLFEPRIRMKQIVELRSSVSSVYNGQYEAVGVTHQGIISGAVGGPCQSTINLFTGTKIFGDYKIIGDA